MRPHVLIVLVLVAPLVVALSPPSAPLSPAAATGASLGEIELTWTAPAISGASPVAGYRVYRSLTSSGLTHLVDLGNVLAFTDTAIPDGAPRYYRVSAVNGDGEGPLSDVVNASAKAAPSAPLAFEPKTGPSRHNITLSWGLPQYNGTADVTSYKVYRAPAWTGPFALQATGTTLNYTDSGLADNATFAYSVSAVNLYGEGPLTVARNATTAHLPGAPRNVTASLDPGFGVVVDWDAPVDAGGLRIERWRMDRAVGTGPFVPHQLVTGFFTRDTDERCPLGQNCTYRIVAWNELGYGALSGTATSQGDALPVTGRCAFC